MNIRIVPNRGRVAQLAYSLTEALVGVSMMGILFVSLYGGISSGFTLTQVARENLRGTQIMMERMEGIRLYNWNQLVYSNWIPSSFTNYYYPITESGESPGIQYVGRMAVADAMMNPPASYSTNLRTILVTVNWTSGGVQRSRAMTTYVSRNGIQNYVYSGFSAY